MQARVLSRAAATAMTVLLLAAATAHADTVPADGDAVLPGNQNSIDLGQASPGQVITWPVMFRLKCEGMSHPAPGTTITLEPSDTTVPDGGAISATTTTIGPVPAGWTPDGEGCPFPAPTLAANAPSVVTMTMPPTAGHVEFTMMWDRTGATGLTSASAITIVFDVVGNTPPTLHLPSNLSAEATSPAGAAVAWTATATDNEDAPPPTPTCSPVSGATFPLGLTTVTCSVIDHGGARASGSFLVSVQDTTRPTVVGMPADQHLTTASPAGAALTYVSPTATDLADPAPVVGCLPASGASVPVGSTTVTCTATDRTGNFSSQSFTVTVEFVSPVAWTARWGEPVATSGGTFVANAGRTIPIKVEIFADGVEQGSGEASLSVATCAGSPVSGGALSLTWDGGRWTRNLDTSRLGGPGCYVATVSLDGHPAGSFRIDLRGDATPASAGGGPKAKTKP